MICSDLPFCSELISIASHYPSDAERAGLEFIYDLRNKFESGEIPFRQPKAKKEEDEEGEGQGLGGLWKAITGGRD